MQHSNDLYKGTVLGTEMMTLGASTYNTMRGLLSRSQSHVVYLPLRELQYMAVIRDKEVNFVDIHMQKVIEMSWQNFRSGARESIDCPVRFSCSWYNKKAYFCMSRIPRVFELASVTLLEKWQKRNEGTAVELLHFPAANEF